MEVLIVEDESELAKSINSYLNQNNYRCEIATDVEEAREKINEKTYDCIILDVMLPFGSGFDLLSELNKTDKANRVIVISAKNSSDDQMLAKKLGAAAYLVKPFHLEELNAKVISLLKGKNHHAITYKELLLNTANKQLKVADRDVEINKSEFSLLLFLLLNKNKVVSKNAIAEHLLGQSALYFDNFDIIHSHIKNLKLKLGSASAYIQTIYNTGYKLS